jgi:hypothetical protein
MNIDKKCGINWTRTDRDKFYFWKVLQYDRYLCGPLCLVWYLYGLQDLAIATSLQGRQLLYFVSWMWIINSLENHNALKKVYSISLGPIHPL